MTHNRRFTPIALMFSILAGATLFASLWASPTKAQSASHPAIPYVVVETGQHFAKLQEAVNAIGLGRGTIRIAPGHYADCAVQTQGEVSFVAEEPGQTVFEMALCEGKAALVLRGVASHVTGLVFNHFAMSDGNGAGIRLEKGNLSVSQSWFHDSEEGILADNDPNGSVTVDRSTFTHLGRCDRGLSCAHSIYVGFYDQVTVTRSRFEKGTGGHYLKARAAHVRVQDNSFDDSQGHATNYMIDLPAGATGRIEGNWFMQGGAKENPSALITIAAESHNHSANGLVITNNVARFAPGVSTGTALVADWVGDHMEISNNRLVDGIAPYQKRLSHDQVADLKKMAGAISLGH